jgi:uncharacterized protein (DUF952 family)
VLELANREGNWSVKGGIVAGNTSFAQVDATAVVLGDDAAQEAVDDGVIAEVERRAAGQSFGCESSPGVVGNYSLDNDSTGSLRSASPPVGDRGEATVRLAARLRGVSPSPERVFHIAHGADWRAARAEGSYRAASLAAEGFLHFSTREQVLGAADRYLRGVPDLVLLDVEVAALDRPLTWEDTTGRGEAFPHLYGALSRSAVRLARRFPERPQGGYGFPPERPCSERLRFEAWTQADEGRARELWGDPEVTRWIDARPQLDAAAVQARIASEIALEHRHGLQYWRLTLAESGDLVGAAGLHPRAGGDPELGFHLCRRHWGRGLATEAAQAVVRFAFEVLVVEGLYAGHNPANEGSRKILEGLGFQRTGEERFPPTGAMHTAYELRRPGDRA